jgi:hypothetical protein
MVEGDVELKPNPSAEDVYFIATDYMYKWPGRIVANSSRKEDKHGFDNDFYNSTEV